MGRVEGVVERQCQTGARGAHALELCFFVGEQVFHLQGSKLGRQRSIVAIIEAREELRSGLPQRAAIRTCQKAAIRADRDGVSMKRCASCMSNARQGRRRLGGLGAASSLTCCLRGRARLRHVAIVACARTRTRNCGGPSPNAKEPTGKPLVTLFAQQNSRK